MNQATVDGTIEAHPADPELSELLQSEMPHRANSVNDFSVRHNCTFRSALAPYARGVGW